MRLITWNCRGAFHKKHQLLTELRPDVAIVQECAAPAILADLAPGWQYRSCDWYSDGAKKGLAVFTFGEWTLERHSMWNPAFHMFLPESVRGPMNFNLLAAWAFNGRAGSAVPNPRSTREAVDYYRDFLSKGQGVLAGDLNASVVWDRPRGKKRFGDVDAALRELGLCSGFHATAGCDLGTEREKTHFHSSGKDFHIDYIYRPVAWAGTSTTTVGDSVHWRKVSDHAPLITTISTPVAV
jgi:exodeoxyribonuclease-3